VSKVPAEEPGRQAAIDDFPELDPSFTTVASTVAAATVLWR
jgi:hypothetical protein